MRKRQESTVNQAAIYIRVSTGKQVKSGLGLDDQRIKTQAEAERRMYNIPEEYVFIDEGVSGKKSGKNRPAYDAMMTLIKEGKISAVIVNDLSRLGRSVQLISNALLDMEDNNCVFISVKESFNTTTAMGKAMLNVVATFAQLESDLGSERTIDGLSTRSKYGYIGGQVIYGYYRNNHTEDVKSDEVIHIDTNEAAVVKRIYRLRKQGKSLQAIVDTLNKEGILSARDKTWGISSIRVIIDNEHIYKGKHTAYPKII